MQKNVLNEMKHIVKDGLVLVSSSPPNPAPISFPFAEVKGSAGAFDASVFS